MRGSDTFATDDTLKPEILQSLVNFAGYFAKPGQVKRGILYFVGLGRVEPRDYVEHSSLGPLTTEERLKHLCNA